VRDRNAVQRSPVVAVGDLTLRGARAGERLVAADVHEREQLWIERLDAVEMCLDHIDGGDLSRADEPRELCRIESAESGVAHIRASSAGPATGIGPPYYAAC
jgi:hypothetical protein